MNEINQKEIWNRIAKLWESYRKVPLLAVDKFLDGKEGKIIDIGCGTGRNFRNINGKFYGVDFSEEMLEYARNNAKKEGINVELECADSDNLPYNDELFDYAICIAVLHCIENFTKREKTLKEMYRVMKKGGKGLITIWSKNHDRIKEGIKEQKIPWTVDGIKYFRYYYIYDKEELENLVKKVGFIIKNISEDENIIIEVEK